MKFREAIKTCFIKYWDFSGRASRSEFWYFTAFTTLLSLGADIIDPAIAGVSYCEYDNWFGPVYLTTSILTFLPSTAVSVRRLHDIDKSGWLLLIALTVIGIIPLVYWAVKDSDIGNNRFGSDPIEKDGNDRVVKPVSIMVRYLVIPFFSILLVGSILIITFEETGMSPSIEVQSGKDLPSQQREELVSNNIILKSDKIIYFYSDGLLSVMEGGQPLTQDQIIAYEMGENGQLKKYRMFYENVKSVKLVEQGGCYSNSIYIIIGDENASQESITMFLSTNSNGDQKFIEELERRVNFGDPNQEDSCLSLACAKIMPRRLELDAGPK